MASVEEVEVVLVVTPRVVEVLVVSFRGGRGSNFRGGCTAVVLLVVVVVVGPVPGVVVVVVVGPVPREVVLVVVGVYDAYPFQDRHLVATGRESGSCSCTSGNLQNSNQVNQLRLHYEMRLGTRI